MKSRNRQFNNIRDKHLSSSYSQMSQSTRNLPTYRQNNQFDHSQSSLFVKNSTPLCVDCTNNKLIKTRRDRQYKDKAKQHQEQQKIIQQARLENQKRKAARRKQAKQVDSYNKKAKQRQMMSVKSEKKLDGFWVEQSSKRQQELVELQAQVAQLRKQKELRYRQQLHEQVQQEKVKRQQIRQERIKTMPEEPIVKGQHFNPQANSYGQDLKKQMANDRLRKQQQKRIQNQMNNQQLAASQKKFLEFTEFKNPRKSDNNPEMFDQMKQLQLQKKLQKIENRYLMEHERKKALKQAKEKLQKSAKEELDRMRKYADTLSAQINQKKRQQQRQKAIDWKETSKAQYTEELGFSKMTKPCAECHVEVPQVEISYL